MDESIQTTRHLLDLCRRSTRQGRWLFSAFLTPAEQDDFLKAPESNGLSFHFWGGTEDAERRILAAGSEEESGPPSYPLSLIRVSPLSLRFAEKLCHPDYLGALMNLGMERSMIGDLLIREDCAFFFCLSSSAEFLVSGLIRVRKTSVEAREIFDAPPELAPRFQDLRFSVASERLDSLVAGFTGLSRSQVPPLFSSGRVFVNSRPVEDRSLRLKSGDILTVRGYGKAVFDGITGETKKGRLAVLLKKYC